jgi:alkylation response protein AidB-like acyl-CoA dehydrogenase
VPEGEPVTRRYAKVGPRRAREEAAMDLTYTAAEEEFRRELRTWLQANIPEEWSRPGFWELLDADESFRLRRDWERDKAGAGFAGIAWPTEYGGRGGTPGMKAIYDEEMVLANAPRTVNGLGLTFLAPTVMAIGTDAQKKEIIGPMLRNEVIWCQGFSEPGAGSDLAAVATRARRCGPRTPSTATRSSRWSARNRGPSATGASPCCSSTCTSQGWTPDR